MEVTEAKRLVGKLMRANRLHRSLIEKYTKEAELHRSQHQLLMYLMKCPSPPSQKEIAATFEVTPAAIAMSLKKLEQKGLVERVASPEDSRVNLITISEKGKEIMERNREIFEMTDTAMLEGVTDGEMEFAAQILDKFIANLLRMGAQDEKPLFCDKNAVKGTV